MSQRIAVVTGGTKGIGRSICRMLADKDIVVCSIYHSDEVAANCFKDEMSDAGVSVDLYKADISDEKEVMTVFKDIYQKYGKIDYLINNAGITKDKAFFSMKEEEWLTVININLVGTIICTQCALKYMIKERFGRIVNLSSVSGIIGSVGQANYSASKAGIIGFTRAMALEVSNYGILVNAVAPGFVETEMVEKMEEKHKQTYLSQVPLERFAKPQEISQAVYDLLKTNYVTGQVISIDGGLTLI